MLDNIVIENPMNIILISDICNYAIVNMIFNIIPILEKLLENKIILKKIFIKKELEKTIKILENLKKSKKKFMLLGKKNAKSVIHINPLIHKLNKIYGDDEKEDNNMLYPNYEELNSDDIEEFDKNLNFEEMDNLFQISKDNINKSKINNITKNNNRNLKNKNKNKTIKNNTHVTNLHKGKICIINVKKNKLKKNNNKTNMKNIKRKYSYNINSILQRKISSNKENVQINNESFK